MCIQSCPFHIIKADPAAYHITIGGKRGRHPRVGYHIVTVRTPETVVKVIELIVKWVYRKAWSDSLLPDQLDILDFESFKKELVAGLEDDEIVTGY
jgi:dissimilatory sulfite reductase (desulfoviridin) alpha/beta subunit